MEQQTIETPSPELLSQYHAWWAGLSNPWKIAFNETLRQLSTTDTLPDALLHQVWTSPVLRFAGPGAPYPNMTIQLDDLDGVLALKQLQIFVFSFQNIQSLKPLANHTGLKSLFVFNNQLRSLEGVENLVHLKEFYFQANQIESLQPLAQLTQLQTIYASDNPLRSLEGVSAAHAGALKQFYVLPTEHLTDAMVMAFERECGIRCLKG
ncbi:MAG: leucine-rich repeat domain-containing protein [Saprospiraceae bacterium]|nr:leucine-rich repeat domain-containing protein [Saprospiraceae bacterium]